MRQIAWNRMTNPPIVFEYTIIFTAFLFLLPIDEKLLRIAFACIS